MRKRTWTEKVLHEMIFFSNEMNVLHFQLIKVRNLDADHGQSADRYFSFFALYGLVWSIVKALTLVES